jgi:hypothetical protein
VTTSDQPSVCLVRRASASNATQNPTADDPRCAVKGHIRYLKNPPGRSIQVHPDGTRAACAAVANGIVQTLEGGIIAISTGTPQSAVRPTRHGNQLTDAMGRRTLDLRRH